MEKETLVAIVPDTEETNEQQLTTQVTDIELRAEAIVISNDADYAAAGEFGTLLKKKANEVTAFFKPMKDNAYQAHKSICDREKKMLAPLKNAEAAVKRAMSAYHAEQERKRRAAEEAARKAAEMERERLMAEAAAKEAAGDKTGAEAVLENAIVMDEATNYIAPAVQKPKVSGVSTSKDWEIVDLEPEKVPIAVNGAVIRPIDRAAVMKLIRASKGAISIPGIVYQEVTRMSFRGGN